MWPRWIGAVICFAGLGAGTTPPSVAQAPRATRDSLLSIRRIFGSSEFAPHPLGRVRWLSDGAAYAALEPAAAAGLGQDIVRYDSERGTREIVVRAAQLIPRGDSIPLAVEDFDCSPDGRRVLIYTNSRRVWRLNTRGDYWVLDRASDSLRLLGGRAKPATLMFAKFSPDGRRVGYVRERNLYVEDLKGGRPIQITTDRSPDIINGTTDWVYEEELFLRDAWRWSPDGRWIAYWQFNTDSVRDFSLINNTDSLYSFVTPVRYPKAGQPNSAVRIGVVGANGGPTRWLAVPGDARNHYIIGVQWAPDSRHLVLQRLNRLQDTKELLVADARTGRVRVVYIEHDSAYIEVAGLADFALDTLLWLPGGRELTWLSERKRWNRIYAVSLDGNSLRAITPDGYDVIGSVRGLNAAEGWLYYIASPDNASQRYLYRTRLDGTASERVTPQQESGTHDYRLSPNSRWAIHVFSRFGVPPAVDLIRLPEHEVIRTLEGDDTLRARVAALPRGPVEFFRIDIGDGIQLDGWMMKPPEFDSTRRHPLLVYVYGEPWGQTVSDKWQGPLYLWHLMLTQQGYVVASVDNRGTSAPRGRAWRKAAFRQLGFVGPADQAAAVRLIRQWPYIDSTRVGVWGASSGGANALHAIFRYPDLYRTAVAVAPYADLRYYDTAYPERYLGLPREHPEAYARGAPLSYAAGLRGDLLIIHGSGDDNAHYQHTELLINALVAARKPFSLMEYPNRTHDGLFGATTGEHLFDLITRYLRDHLLEGRP